MTHLINTFDGETKENAQREMSADEVADLLAYQTAAQQEKAVRETELADIKATKLAAYQKMGLTQKEIDALMPPDPAPLPTAK
jgi:hypothetical protein